VHERHATELGEPRAGADRLVVGMRRDEDRRRAALLAAPRTSARAPPRPTVE
jgi:hypothetical protein